MRSLFGSLLGPQLYRIRKTGTTEGFLYTPNGLEAWGDRIISFLHLAYKTALWTSPALAGCLLWRGCGASSLVRLAVATTTLLAAAVLLRTAGRASNPHYTTFLQLVLDEQHPERRRRLAGYDFNMRGWPVDFTAGEVPGTPEAGRPPPLQESAATLPTRLLSWVLVHTIGRRLMYPGSIGFMNALLAPALLEGRARLVEELGGERHLLQAADGSRIDTMLVDRRRSAGKEEPGHTLVVCCEGNAGFYEIGATSAPLEAGYSVLGWNHPGFGGSSGVPLPASERAAIAAVLEFAERRLGFPPERTVLYAWSIGGYTASWAAATHPDVAGVVLDATFDDVLPLAVARMPPSWESLVRAACRRHLHLNNGRQLALYQGPVLLVRRSMDEVITTSEQEVATNRANDLLLQLMSARFPALLDDVSERHLQRWARADAATQAEVATELGVEEELCRTLLASHLSGRPLRYPLTIGEELDSSLRSQLAIYVASKLMIEMEGTHCTPMAGSFFRLPWQLPGVDTAAGPVTSHRH